MEARTINQLSFKQKFRAYLRDPVSLIFAILVGIGTILTAAVLAFLTIYIMVKGIPHINLQLFEWNYNTTNVSLMPALINTILMTALALLIAAPIGVFSAIYLIEYAAKDNKLVKIIGITAETLSGIPSIVYGLFGLLFFVTYLGWGLSLLSGAFTLSIMILPLIMRTTEEALKAVPHSYREGSFGLGAGKLRTVFKIILPSASPGILAGIILAVGRIVGETAALIYTAGTVAKIPQGGDFLFDSTRTLAVHMYALTSEGLYTDQAYATAVVLFIIVVLINWLSGIAAKKLTRT
jgi:phosphate transport system permease protein